jgi:hypothetical protein
METLAVPGTLLPNSQRPPTAWTASSARVTRAARRRAIGPMVCTLGGAVFDRLAVRSGMASFGVCPDSDVRTLGVPDLRQAPAIVRIMSTTSHDRHVARSQDPWSVTGPPPGRSSS